MLIFKNNMMYVLKQICPNASAPINITITADEMQIGRKTIAALSIYPQVSRLHLILYKSDSDQLFVKDLNSTNGVFVNGVRIGTSLHLLNIGDKIGFGVPCINGTEGYVCLVSYEVKQEVIDLTEDDDIPPAANLTRNAECVQPLVTKENKAKSAKPACEEGIPGTSILNETTERDLINGAAGNDILNKAAENSVLDGAARSSVSNGSAGSSVSNKAAENRVLNKASGSSVLIKTAENSVLDGAARRSASNGSAGSIVSNKVAENRVLNKAAGSSVLNGTARNSALNGAARSSVVDESVSHVLSNTSILEYRRSSYTFDLNFNASNSSDTSNFSDNIKNVPNNDQKKQSHKIKFLTIPLVKCDSKFFRWPTDIKKPFNESLAIQYNENSPLTDSYSDNNKKYCKRVNPNFSCNVPERLCADSSANFHQNYISTEAVDPKLIKFENKRAFNCAKRKSSVELDKTDTVSSSIKKCRSSCESVKDSERQFEQSNESAVPMCLVTGETNKNDIKFQEQSALDDEACYSQVEEIIYISDDESYLDFNSSQNCTFIKTEPDLSDDGSADEICKEIFDGHDSDGVSHNVNIEHGKQNEVVDKVESIETIKAFVNATEDITSEVNSINIKEGTSFQMTAFKTIQPTEHNENYLNINSRLSSRDNKRHKENLSVNKDIEVESTLENHSIAIQNNENHSDFEQGNSSKGAGVKRSSGKILLTDPKPLLYRPRKRRGREEWFKEQEKYSEADHDTAKSLVPKQKKNNSTSIKKKSIPNLKHPPIKIQTNNANTYLQNFKIPLKSKTQNNSDQAENFKSRDSLNDVSNPNTSHALHSTASVKKVPRVKTRPEKFGSRMHFLLDIETTPKKKKRDPNITKHDKVHNNSNKNSLEKLAVSENVDKPSCAFAQDPSLLKEKDPRLHRSENLLQGKCLVAAGPTQTKSGSINIPDTVTNVSAVTSKVLENRVSTIKESTSSVPFEVSFLGMVKDIVQMHPLWLHEQKKFKVPPPNVRKGAADLPLYFNSYDSYATLFYPMIKLEIWEYMYEESKPVYESNKVFNKFYFSILSCSSGEDCNELKCESVVNEKESYSPREGSIVILDVIERSQNCCKPIFGYVYKHRIDDLSMNSVSKKWKQLPSKWLTNAKHWTFSVYIKKRPMNYESQGIMRGNGICYIRSKLRLADALGSIKNSPLLTDILTPRPASFSITDVPVSSPAREYNSCQTRVINSIYAEVRKPATTPKILLLQGPPGTGKTHTIIGLLEKLISTKCNSKILMTAPSNAAIDEIGLRLIELNEQSSRRDNKIKFVRVGLEKQINPKVKEYFLDKKANELYKQSMISELNHKDRELRNLKAEIAKLEKENANSFILKQKICEYKHLKEQSSSKKDFYADMPYKRDILKESQIILSTLNSCGLSILLKTFKPYFGMQFSCCIVDESTQCTELEILQPLIFGMSKLILVGDHEQLPATVTSQVACYHGYDRSLFERFHLFFETYYHKSPVSILTEQFRMHSEICSFPSKHFYSEKLHTFPGTDIRDTHFPLKPYIFLDILGSQETSDRSSKLNCNEASVIINICKYILNQKIPSTSIGIITPYQAQRSLYIKALSQNPYYRDIEVNTVDGFQGREKDVIIFSSVRANSSSGDIGFVACRRRLNVSITRARKCLIICAHTTSLMHDVDWKALIYDARARKICFRVTSPKDIPVIFDRYVHKRK